MRPGRETGGAAVDGNGNGNGSGNSELMNSFYRSLGRVREYHDRSRGASGRRGEIVPIAGGGDASTNTAAAAAFLSGSKRRHGHPQADGYDVASLIDDATSSIRSGAV